MITYGAIKSGEAAVPVVKVTDTKAVVTQTITGKLPGMIRAAADKLAAATSAAEVLDARDEARLTYSTAQVAGRIAKAKGAHDKVVAAAHRAQADALEIEAEAKRRLADEYDGAQQRGEAQKAGGDRKSKINVPQRNNDPAKVDEIGLTRKDVHDARRVRNAEQVQPGVVKAALDQAIAEGREPSRAVVNEAIAEALGEEKPAHKPRNIFDELVSLWKEASAGVRQDFKAYIKGSEAVAKLNLTDGNPAPGTGGENVDRSAERASSAVEVGATNSPDGATRAVERRISEGSPIGEAEDASVTSSGGENPAINPVANVGEGANGAMAAASVDPASRDVDGADRQQPATFGITGEAYRDAGTTPICALTTRDDITVGTNSQSAVPTAEAAAETPMAPRPSAAANPFKPLSRADQVRLIRPHCQHPGTDKCAGSGRNHCHACKKLIESEAA